MKYLYTLKGTVVYGKNRGHDFGFPTVNFPLLPEVSEGIYISQIKILERVFNSLSFVGSNKTFAETRKMVETYVLDFDKDIYGQEVEVYLIKKIRDNMKFKSAEELVEQMEKDREDAIDFFDRVKRSQ